MKHYSTINKNGVHARTWIKHLLSECREAKRHIVLVHLYNISKLGKPTEIDTGWFLRAERLGGMWNLPAQRFVCFLEIMKMI